MPEDKLTHDERLRLECLAQAVGLHAIGPKPSPEVIVTEAKAFEKYVATKEDG